MGTLWLASKLTSPQSHKIRVQLFKTAGETLKEASTGNLAELQPSEWKIGLKLIGHWWNLYLTGLELLLR